MRPGSTKWTLSEEGRLRNLVAAKKTAKEAGEILGRHTEVVRRKAMNMGLAFTRSPIGRPVVTQKTDPVALLPEAPRYSSRMAMMMGDPPIGRSALDRKAAGHGD